MTIDMFSTQVQQLKEIKQSKYDTQPYAVQLGSAQLHC